MGSSESDLSLCTIYADVISFKNINISLSQYLKVYHMNIRSLNKNHDALTNLLSFLEFGFDVIILSELWIYNLIPKPWSRLKSGKYVFFHMHSWQLLPEEWRAAFCETFNKFCGHPIFSLKHVFSIHENFHCDSTRCV